MKKKNKLKENIKFLENISAGIQDSINKLKIILENINQEKQNFKKDVQEIFTKIRNELNIREDKLLEDIDKYYENSFFDENLIKQANKLPDKIQISVEKGKIIEKEWEKSEIKSLINDCISIETNLKDIINLMKELKNIRKMKILKWKLILKTVN